MVEGAFVLYYVLLLLCRNIVFFVFFSCDICCCFISGTFKYIFHLLFTHVMLLYTDAEMQPQIVCRLKLKVVNIIVC